MTVLGLLAAAPTTITLTPIASMTLQIYRLIKARDLVERLMEFLAALGQDVEITVRPTRRKEHGELSVVVRLTA